DALGRLASWYDPATDATTTYAYDAAYNLTQTAVDGSVTASFAFDGADRISSSGYGYDQRGNMTADPTHRYRYDALNRLTAVLDAASETTIAAYTYDFENRRTSAADASGTVYFHYDGASANVIAETDGAGATIASYAYDAAGRIHSMSRAGATYYYHTNAHGDVVAVTNATGEVANTYRYDPWGRVLEANETVPNPYRYASYRYDERAGLYYLWHRWYDAGTMRFMTKDVHPTQRARPVSMNSYVYCEGDPVNLVDPTGLSARAWVQYAADSLVFVLRVAAVFTLGLGVILGGNAGVIGAGVLLALLGRIVDAGADANWDAQRCGNRAVGNPDWAAYYMAKYFSGPLAPAVGAASDFLRGLLVDIPNSIDRLWEDADWLEEEW
ncbi:MAG: hypothetical protein M0Z94_12295, partial [Dehalococcoidales bacterium]|nr:hypothetical protein [Dehalococcoidales bacterium]